MLSLLILSRWRDKVHFMPSSAKSLSSSLSSAQEIVNYILNGGKTCCWYSIDPFIVDHISRTIAHLSNRSGAVILSASQHYFRALLRSNTPHNYLTFTMLLVHENGLKIGSFFEFPVMDDHRAGACS